MNGEHYAGGTFLPSTRLPKRGAQALGRGDGRVLVEPGVFVCPLSEYRVIFNAIRALVTIENGMLAPAFADNHPAMRAYVGEGADQLAAFHAKIEAYNAGQRFI